MVVQDAPSDGNRFRTAVFGRLLSKPAAVKYLSNGGLIPSRQAKTPGNPNSFLEILYFCVFIWLCVCDDIIYHLLMGRALQSPLFAYL